MIIQNAKVFDKQGVFVSKDIYIEKERIASSNQQSQDILDASGCLAVPSLIRLTDVWDMISVMGPWMLYKPWQTMN